MDSDTTQRVILGLLLEHHPRMLDLDEIGATVGEADADSALRRLSDDGLVNRLGAKVGVSRPVVRFEQLGPI